MGRLRPGAEQSRAGTRLAQALSPFRHTSMRAGLRHGRSGHGSLTGAPCMVLGNSEPAPRGRERERRSCPVLLTKARFSGAGGPRQAHSGHCLLWHPVPGRAAATPHCSTLNPAAPRDGSESQDTPLPEPSRALVSFQHQQGLELVLGVSAHGSATLLMDQLLTSWFLPRWSKHNLGLFMGSSTVTFP